MSQLLNSVPTAATDHTEVNRYGCGPERATVTQTVNRTQLIFSVKYIKIKFLTNFLLLLLKYTGFYLLNC